MNLVFATGVALPQMLAGQEYFRGMKAKYPDAIFPKAAAFGTIATRAQQLADGIRQRFPTGPVHVVGHSMAGLDTRYLITRNLNGLAERIVSLSTISTPHAGTPLADFLVAPKPNVFDLGTHLLYETITEAMRVLGWDAGAFADLTTVSAKKFNAENPDRQSTHYFAYAGMGVDSFVLKPSHALLSAIARTPEEVQNDGTVTIASAMRTGLVEAPWRADHLAQVGHDLDRPGFVAEFDHFAAIDRIVLRLPPS